MRRRALKVVLIAVPAAIVIAGASIAAYNRVNFGTFYTADAPPRVVYCGRSYIPGDTPRTDTLAHVNGVLAANGMSGLTRIGSSPSGLPIVTNIMSTEMRAAHSTNVCTMELWVQTGADAYVGYVIEGGP
jgi:hypothetical protein